MKTTRQIIEHSIERCPGCGCMPGDGINPDCDHPEGCGYWKEVDHRYRHPSHHERELRDFRERHAAGDQDAINQAEQ